MEQDHMVKDQLPEGAEVKDAVEALKEVLAKAPLVIVDAQIVGIQNHISEQYHAMIKNAQNADHQ